MKKAITYLYYTNDFPDYCTAMKQVASEKNCAIIDMMTKCLNLLI